MDKQQIYKLIIKTPHKFLSSGIDKFKKKDILKNLNEDFSTWEELYDILNPDVNIICDRIKCNKKKKFKSFTRGYNRFCSIECNNKWLSYSRMGDNNPVHRMTEETRREMGRKNSENLKRLIKEGKFNPTATNSWCNSRYEIYFKRDNGFHIEKVRSSWEAFFNY